MKLRLLPFLTTLGLIVTTACRADEATPTPSSVSVLPETIELRHQRRPHALQVFGTTADGYALDLRAFAKFKSADPKIASVDAEGWVRPIANGQTQVTVTVAGQTRTVAVKVQLPATEPPLSFRHEVMPVLTRAGCNMGACHGYSLGKNGFKLSLRGADPRAGLSGHRQGCCGRRVELPVARRRACSWPSRRGDVPHEGGVRFPRDSLSRRDLAQVDPARRPR